MEKSHIFKEAACLAWATILWQFTGCEDVILAVEREDHQTSATHYERNDMTVVHLSLKYTLKIEDVLDITRSQINNAKSPSIESTTSTGATEYTSTMSFSPKRPRTVHKASSSLWWDGIQKPEAWISPSDEWKCSRMIARLKYCTGQICSQPFGPLSGLLGASPTELAIIKEWNQQPLTRHDRCIHHLIEEKARSQPDHSAIESWDGTLTYAELDRIASQYAILLRSNGVRPEKFVGIYLHKSRWTAVAILAVLKSGGAFVLLDTSHPVERLKVMCQAVRVSLVLKFSEEQSSNLALTGFPVLEIGDDDLHEVSRLPAIPTFRSEHAHAAYVAFTSGSTGRPKGIIIQHGMFSTGSLSHGPAYQMTSESRVFQFSSYAFDGAIMEHLTTLIAGGCVCIPSPSEQFNDLPAAFAKLNANFICLTPSVLHILLPSQIPSLRTLAVTGELMSKELVQRWAPHVQLIITYGPTECSVASSTTIPVYPDSDPRVLGSTHNCRFWVADPDCAELLTPPGAIGELFIEGPIVGRGYVNADLDTMAVYGPNRPWLDSIPFPDRTYRTGDIVQYTDANGSLRYLGRKDSQVKIRGQRVELGEIEHSIRSEFQDVENLHLAVEAVLLPGKTQNRSLVVFFGISRASTGENGALAPPCLQLLQQWDQKTKPSLLQSLPNYMVPAMIVPVTRFPFTLSGKTDRKQLQTLFSELSREEVDLYLGVEFVALAPVSPMEVILQKSISETLNIDCHKVSTDRSFVELGGDSVDMMRLVSSLREQGIQLSVSDVMSCPDIAVLSRKAQIIIKTSEVSLTTDIEPFSLLSQPGKETARNLVSEHLPGMVMDDIADLLPATEFQHLLFLGPEDYITMHFEGPVNEVRLEQSCQELIQRHSILRTIFVKHQEDLFQLVLKKPHEAFVHRRLDAFIPDFAEQLWNEQRYDETEMDSPVTRFYFAQCGAEESLLVFRPSHAQYDADSINLLQRELFSIYRGELKTKFAPDFAIWVHDFLSQNAIAGQEFWKSHLTGSSMTYIGQPFAVRFPDGETFTLDRRIDSPVSPPHGITMASLVKAAWALVLTETVGVQDVVFGQWMSCRDSPQTGEDPTIGPCLNIVPVRVNLKAGDIHTVQDLLAAVQHQHAQTIPYSRVQLSAISRISSWPPNAVFGTEVLHNTEEHGDKAIIQVDPTLKASVQAYSPQQSSPKLRWLIIESYVENGDLGLRMFTTTTDVSRQEGKGLLDRLAQLIQACANDPSASLHSIMKS
ncbi:hypothetical protein IFR05_015011 [Cadophora sp. M221]|nr:hypothetical protein IFR05_015011 [Cadophora sp. M221]